MVSNDCKEKCRDFGMLVENIICMADCYEEPIEKFRKSMFYKPEFEDKEKIILDMIDTSNRVSEEIKLLSIEDLKKLQDEYGIELIGYTDMLATALRKEPYSNNEVKYKCDAIMSIVLDMLHRELREDILLLLQEELEKKTDSGIHRWLYSYLPPCNDGEEFMDTLITFEVDCDAFYNVNKDITVQITEKEFMEVVEEFNRHCDLKNLLSEVYNLNIIETDRGILSQENCYLIVDKTLNIFLPRVTKETNVRKYVGEFLGLLIYELEVQRAGANRTSRNLRNSSKKIRQSRLTTQELYRICFYDVFLVEEITEERFVPKKEIGKVANHFDVIIANIVDNSSNEY